MRSEFKYIVPENKMDRIRQMILPYVDVDKFAQGKTNNQYTVRSIYFDTPKFDYYFEKIDGIKNRKKLRIRGYNEENIDNTVFLEIKRKYEMPIVKFRAPVTYGNALDIFEKGGINGHIIPSNKFPKAVESAQRFLYHVYSSKLRPVVLVIYEREPYLYKFDKTVRVTFDKNLRGKGYPSLTELYCEDNINRSLHNHFILEIKFNKHFPGWMNNVIAVNGLKRQAASKYCICLDESKIVSNITKSSLFIKSNWTNSINKY